MKIKYLSGKKADQVADLDDVNAKSLIEDGLAEAVVEESPLDLAMKGLDSRITSAVETATAGIADKLVKGVNKLQPSIVVGTARESMDPTGGFKSLGHFAKSVRDMRINPNDAVDPTMVKYLSVKAAAAVANSETASPDAGPTVPVQYLSNIFSVTGNIKDWTSNAFKVPMNTLSCNIPVLKNYNRANATATAGVVATTPGEGVAAAPSKTNWEQLQLSLVKEMVLVPASDELLSDNIVALDAVITSQAAYQIQKALNGGMLNGSSASAAMTGIIGHASAVTVTRATANTVAFADVMAMYAKFNFDDSNYDNCVWFVHPTVLSQLATMTSGNFNIYFPPGGAQTGSVGMLLGRPIIVTGWAKPLGTTGDLILADLSKYVVGYKGGLNSAQSVHLYFDADQVAFRFTLRINGKPGLSGPITLEDGTTTVSPFVVLHSNP